MIALATILGTAAVARLVKEDRAQSSSFTSSNYLSFCKMLACRLDGAKSMHDIVNVVRTEKLSTTSRHSV
eukprot:SAG31_NODE_25479_length_460_cov_1.168975_1_plen_69_part_01